MGYNLVAGARFEVNARGIITRDDKLQTAYEKQLYHRAKFYALNRCPRDARGAGTICQTDPFERISASVTGTLRLFNFVFDRTRDLETKIV